MEWKSVFETGHLLTALEVLRHTDAIMIGPGSLHAVAQEQYGFRSIKVPDLNTLQVDCVLVSHRRTDNSAPHQWLRQIILALGENPRSELPRADHS